MSDTITTAAAGAAVASPWWLPAIATISEVFQYVLPIAGVVWLVVQIVSKIKHDWFTKDRNGDQ